MSARIIEAYYAAFNAGDFAGMLDLVTDDVIHDINQGAREVGREAFERFLGHMDHTYREQLHDIVVMSDARGVRHAAEFMVHGVYSVTDPGFPEARGQKYVLPAGAFLETRDGKIARVSTYYNVREWIRQVEAGNA
jgi:steroid delta-isomerase-like uncharacterized protein